MRRNGYEGQVYVHVDDTIVCYFCGKTRHVMSKCRITGVNKICIHPYPSIDNVLFNEGLKHNLLSISQLYASQYGVSFNKDECVVLCEDGSPLFSAKRKGNIHKIRMGELSIQRCHANGLSKKITGYGIENLAMQVGD